MNDDAASALAAALTTISEDRAAADIARLRKALALRGYTVVPFPPSRTACVVDANDLVICRDPLPERELTVLDGMGADTLLDGVARLAAGGARGAGVRLSPGEVALVDRAVKARRGAVRAYPSERWIRILLNLAAHRAVRWEAEDAEIVRLALAAAGYPREQR